MGRRVLRRGSKKGLSRRHLEGRSTPFREYDPLGVCPNYQKADPWTPWWLHGDLGMKAKAYSPNLELPSIERD